MPGLGRIVVVRMGYFILGSFLAPWQMILKLMLAYLLNFVNVVRR